MAAAGLLGLAPAASAERFVYKGAEQTYTVPAGITGLHVVLAGAAGDGAVGGNAGVAGEGAQVVADLPVRPGTTLYVEVGGPGRGADPPSTPYTSTGGWNGGGTGPFGGGGASDIRTVSCGTPAVCATGGSQASLESRLVVAGGGGGGYGGGAPDGGAAGEPDGSGTGGSPQALGGAGASIFAAGVAAGQTTVTPYCQQKGGTDGERGLAGGLGVGGTGAYVLLAGTPMSGGGGGGLQGGGGGAQCYTSGATATSYAGGGGAGSSGAPGGQNAAVNSAYSFGFVESAEVIITTPVPAAAGPPAISGGPTVGDVLTEGHAAWSTPRPLSAYAYQWERCDATGARCAAIGGATAQTYQLQAADIGHTLRVGETAHNFYGPASTPATSGATGVVQVRIAPAVTITGPATPVLGTPATFTAAITDPSGSPNGYRWTLAGAPAGAAPTLSHTFTGAGPVTVGVTVTDTAGNQLSATRTVIVVARRPLGRIRASLRSAFARSGHGFRIRILTVGRAPVGATIAVRCHGGGCRRAITVRVRAPRCSHGARCTTPRTTATVALAPRLRAWRLAGAATLTVRIVRPRYVGRVYVFSMRRPSVPRTACLAPGRAAPAVAC